MINRQAPDKLLTRDDSCYEVREIFSTIQGEGPFAGRPAIFVRLAGCNLQCPACDTDYTGARNLMSADYILTYVCGLRWSPHDQGTKEKHFKGLKLVVITGGEPFRQRLGYLVRALVLAGYTVQIETNGTLWRGDDAVYRQEEQLWPADAVHIVCSPKTGAIHPELRKRVSAFKYVIEAGGVSPEDGLPIRTMGQSAVGIARPSEDFKGQIFVQPLDEGDPTLNQNNLQACVKSSLKFGYTLGIQIHKNINLP